MKVCFVMVEYSCCFRSVILQFDSESDTRINLQFKYIAGYLLNISTAVRLQISALLTLPILKLLKLHFELLCESIH